MFNDPQKAQRGTAHLHQSPRRRARGLGTPADTPAITPHASPERRNRSNSQPQHGWQRSRNVAPATIDVSGGQTRAGRGHQFTVGNVSNGMIYLRPVTRPAPDQSNQNKSNYTPLQTPPNSAEEAEVRRRELSQSYDGAQVSPPRTPTTRKPVERSKENAPYIKSSPPVPRTRHQRSHSYSAADDHFGSAGGTNLQVRIDQYDGPDNSEPLRPRTAGHPKSFQSLEVQIPNYNLGSPRFSPNGTPFLYGTSSLNVPSTVGEMGSSHTSSQQLDGRWLWPSIDPRALSPSLRSQTGMDTTISTAMAPQSLFRINSQQSISNSPISPETMSPIQLVPSPPIPNAPGPVEIDPKIYDKLSFPPDSDDPTIVRYDSASGAIIAAIPARIIAEVTSASFVDYHLVSDFFLTFRLFMNARDLAAHLIARLRWAIDRGDETGKVVRVRTFVAIRHWILNYFADDFLPHLGLRKEFANSLNNLANNAQVYGNASDLNIIGELKKCWRKTCALYWDNMEIPRTGAEPGVEVDIKPGGPPGTRDGSISRPQSTILRVPPVAATPPPKLDIPVYNPGMDSFLHDVVQPRAPWNDGNQLKERMSAPLPALPRSATAYTKSSTSRTEAITDDNTVSGRHNTSSFQDPSSSKKGGKPHKRTGSFSDALRDNRYHLPLQNSIAKSTQLLMALPYAGSLVRGNLFPPTPAHVDIIAPSTPVNELASFTFNISSSSTNTISKLSEKHLTVPLKITGGPGMKKLFGSFVKTIGVKMKPNSLSPNKGKTPATSAPISRSASVRSNISTLETIAANVSKYGMRTSGDGKPTRIDLLGAGAVDAFQKAMMEEIAYTDHGQDSSAMATDETSRDGDMDTQRRDIVDGPADTPQISEKGKRSILDELESIKQRALEARSAANSAGGNSGSANFLDSASTSGASSTRGHEGSILGATSFLEDNSSPEDYGHHSPMVEQQERIPSPVPSADRMSIDRGSQMSLDQQSEHMSDIQSSHLSDVATLSDMQSLTTSLRRSKSFSFGRVSSHFNRIMGGGDRYAISPSPTGDIRSLHSARSFSHIRSGSLLSQIGSVITMDNIAEFIESGPPTNNEGSGLGMGGRTLLRRRPGGNLKAVATIGELEQPIRPMSTGSIGTGILSLEDTRLPELQIRPRQRAMSPESQSSLASGPRAIATGIVSLGFMGKELPSLPSPIPESTSAAVTPEPDTMASRVSFEAGVQLLREIPDDEDDDGGLDVALMKLEGKFPRKTPIDENILFDFRSSRATSVSQKLSSKAASRLVGSYHDHDDYDHQDEHHESVAAYDGIQEEEDEDEDEDEDYDDEDDYGQELRRRHQQTLSQQTGSGSFVDSGSLSGDGRGSRDVRRESNDSRSVRLSSRISSIALPTAPLRRVTKPITRMSGGLPTGLPDRASGGASGQFDGVGGSKPKNLSGGSLGVAGPSNPSIGAPGPPHPSANTIGLALSSGLPVPSLGAAGSAVDLAAVDSRLTSHLNSRQTNHGNRSDDGKSDLSSELSFENLPAVKMIKKQSSANTFPPIGAGTIISELGLPAHPLRHPPSPPLTVKTPKTAGTTGTARTTGKRSVSQPHAAPQSAGTGPGSGRRSGPSTSGGPSGFSSSGAATAWEAREAYTSQTRSTINTAATAEQPRPIRQSQIFQPTAVHLPFILAYDSELLAKQFTLIEKDALLEVDWKELVELNWSQADADVKDWVELLNSRDIKGVEVVVARFNLMCRWARSSIVMTASADERARTIVKLIHIAAHARRLNNYATMYQLTIALLTADIARLHSTWELISPVEMLTFRELEALVQPVRNFHNLRVEMEKVTGETGCIPFVGLFTHDLILNAQRPLWMHFVQGGRFFGGGGSAGGESAGGFAAEPRADPRAGTSPGAGQKNGAAAGGRWTATAPPLQQPLQPLVNFERHRMTAGIVKKLLRLIEASHQYKFTAVDGVCERCLWISALDDDEIRGLSLGIEPPGVGERYYVGGGN